VEDFLLVKHNRVLQPDIPFVIITGLEKIEASRRALEEGAFDLIPTPQQPQQTVETIRLALWHSTLKASKERRLEKYCQHILHQARKRALARLNALRQ
jgi:DNA-binding NtrC family response regulator